MENRRCRDGHIATTLPVVVIRGGFRDVRNDNLAIVSVMEEPPDGKARHAFRVITSKIPLVSAAAVVGVDPLDEH